MTIAPAASSDQNASGLRIGLFGGTFDPPHVGHLVTAVNVMHALHLDLVILMVANVPWQKEGSRTITPAQDRFAMVEAAVAAVPGLVAGDTEIRMGGPSYTVDTLRSLRQQDAEYASATFKLSSLVRGRARTTKISSAVVRKLPK